MPIIRNLTLTEVPLFYQLCAICFNEPMAPLSPESYDDQKDILWQYYGAFDEQNRLLAAFHAHDYTVNYAGQTAKMAGIGGVTSQPEHRKNGSVRALFTSALPTFYEKGYTFSALYPFSHEFYRKFGYEPALARRRAFFPPEALRGFPMTGSVQSVLPGDENGLRAMLGLYERYAKTRDFSVLRDEKGFAKRLIKDPYTTRQSAYLWRDESGAPGGYVVMEMQRFGEEWLRVILDMAYLSPAALRGIFGFLARFNSFKGYGLYEPNDIDLRALLPEPYALEEKTECRGMARVVNAERALSLLPAPIADGEAVLRVVDGQIAQNNACFRVTAQGGQTTVRRCDDAPNLTVSPGVLAQLALGMMDFSSFLYSGAYELAGDPKWLAMLFPKRVTHMNENF